MHLVWRFLLGTWLALLVSLAPESARAVDTDGDGVEDSGDNCTQTANADQHDDDQDLFGDVCDADLNNDNTTNLLDLAEFKGLFGTTDREGDLNGDTRLDFLDLGRLKDLFGQAPGPRGATAAEIDPPEFLVDPLVTPATAEIPGIGGGPPRPLGRIVSTTTSSEYQLDVVLGEVVVITADPSKLGAFIDRWNGQLLDEFDPAVSYGLTGWPAMYLVSVDTSGVDSSGLAADFAALDGRVHGVHRASAQEVLDLLALVVSEIGNFGLDVSINALLRSALFEDRATSESPTATVAPPDGSTYVGDAFQWPYLKRDPDLPGDFVYPIDSGVTEAWRVLETAGRLSNRVRMMIWDGGFYPNADFPLYQNIGPLRAPNPDPTYCGAGAPSPTCNAHGTHVVLAGFGVPDNGFGTAGPGGPVGDLRLLQSPSLDIEGMARFLFASIPAAVASRPRALTMSATLEVPAALCLLVCEGLDYATSVVDALGVLLIAAAGNESINVDATDEVCFIGCVTFEVAAQIPCELDDVLCVGALDYGSSRKANYSNFGAYRDRESVDLFAPGSVWSVTALAADEGNPTPNDDVQIVSGTSFAAPFVAGVAALVWAGDPSLDNHAVERCILDTAHTQSFSAIPRRVHALGAVRCAVGDTHPFVRITEPNDGAVFLEGTQAVEVRADADDYEDGSSVTITWSSNLDGVVGSSLPGALLSLGSLTLRQGTHQITASVVDSGGNQTSDQITIQILNSPPVVSVLQPYDGASFEQSDTISLLGASTDANGTPPGGSLSEAQVRWLVDSTEIGTGHSASLPLAGLSLGTHYVHFEGTDDDGGMDWDTVAIQVVPAQPGAPDVQILAPTDGTTYQLDQGPVTVPLSWSAVDPEEGPFSFNELQWTVSTDGGPEQPLAVTSRTVCVQPGPFGCELWGTFYETELDAVGSQVITQYRIFLRATDTEGNTGEDNVVVFVWQFI